MLIVQKKGCSSNFSHLLLDIFYSALKIDGLKRTKIGSSTLSLGVKGIDINPREGVIKISDTAHIPYQLHLLERIKDYLEEVFIRFTNGIKGKLGFSYNRIEWEIRF
ncbi:MAG: hypothetical protein N2745_06480 [Syntrophorhabdaceae bacterium]|nr:hypothetical protein [Syntrophorhabdaceae bacterium]